MWWTGKAEGKKTTLHGKGGRKRNKKKKNYAPWEKVRKGYDKGPHNLGEDEDGALAVGIGLSHNVRHATALGVSRRILSNQEKKKKKERKNTDKEAKKEEGGEGESEGKREKEKKQGRGKERM